jgi:hypothetical protein
MTLQQWLVDWWVRLPETSWRKSTRRRRKRSCAEKVRATDHTMVDLNLDMAAAGTLSEMRMVEGGVLETHGQGLWTMMRAVRVKVMGVGDDEDTIIEM